MKPSTAAIILAGVAALLAIVLQTARLDRAQTAAVRAGLAADTLVASRDTARVLTLKLASLGDSVAIVQRRAVQVDQRADALDRALGLERAARDSLSATVAAYRAVIRSDTVFDTVQVNVKDGSGASGSAPADPDGVRRGTFDVRQVPYAMHAEVELPAPPVSGSMKFEIDLDTLRLDVRLGCGPSVVAGARSATLTVIGPSWATVRMGRVEQSPAVCSGLDVGSERLAAIKGLLSRVGISIGYVAGVDARGTFVYGPGVTVGVRVWP